MVLFRDGQHTIQEVLDALVNRVDVHDSGDRQLLVEPASVCVCLIPGAVGDVPALRVGRPATSRDPQDRHVVHEALDPCLTCDSDLVLNLLDSSVTPGFREENLSLRTVDVLLRNGAGAEGQVVGHDRDAVLRRLVLLPLDVGQRLAGHAARVHVIHAVACQELAAGLRRVVAALAADLDEDRPPLRLCRGRRGCSGLRRMDAAAHGDAGGSSKRPRHECLRKFSAFHSQSPSGMTYQG